MWSLWGLVFLIVWQSQESNTSYQVALGNRCECSKRPRKKLKGFWWSCLRSPGNFNSTLSYWLALVKSLIRGGQIQGEGIWLRPLIRGVKNLQPSLKYYRDHIKRKPRREMKLAVIFRKYQRVERLQHENLDLGRCLGKRESDTIWGWITEICRAPMVLGPCRITRKDC